MRPARFLRHSSCFSLLVATACIIAGGCRSGANEGDTRAETPASVPAVIPLSPDAERFVREARRALGQRHYAQGLAWADSAITHAPFAPDGHFVQGLIRFELGRMDEAEASYREAQRIQADYPGLAHNLGNVAFEQKRYRDALAYYVRETERNRDPNPWHGLGATYETLGDPAEAREAYEQALVVDPNYAPAHAALADWHEREGDFPTALAHAEAALALDGDHLDWRYKTGALLRRTGQPAAALPHLRAVLEAQPWNYQAAFSLGQSLRDLGRLDEATYVLDQGNRLRAEQQDVERYGREALLAPESFQGWLTYADALRRSGRLAEALDAYHVALSLRPNNLALQANIATLYAQTNRPGEAEALFRQVLRADSTHAEAWVNLGLLYLRAGDRAQADAALHRAFRYGEGNPAVEGVRERLQRPPQ